MTDRRGPGPTDLSQGVWIDRLAEALGGDGAAAMDFRARVPAGYQQQVAPELAAVDARHVAGLDGSQRFAVRAADSDGFRLRRYGRSPVELSAFLPLLESFGLAVVEAVPMTIGRGADGAGAHIDDFGLRRLSPGPFEPADGDRLVEAIGAVVEGRSDTDSLNRLVLAAGLDWVQVRLVRAYRRYRRQAGSPYTDEQLDDPLVAFPAVVRALVELFEARFAPEGPGDGTAARAAVLAGLAEVQHLEQDQVLRGYLALVDATLRTSYFLRAPGGAPLPTVSLKLDSRAVPDLPLPRPVVETWVHGHEVEGVHLRFGLVARGGIRWSDRPDDFRTEVLGLAAAQVKKNAVIVPTGAKGGFVVRTPVPPIAAGVQAAYEAFISSLLDITDNYSGGRVVGPPAVVARDGDDPYLVVAADKGTATLSDTANALAEERGFWLGDAFASGGSHGYDHKAMGITARGAWVAVRRHFHQLGVDVQTETVTVAGIGDMSGDVFGNGMLQSRAIALVAAFDHRHVFVDPDPDPKASFAERQRLFGLGRSSWADYDRTVISDGGGVWPRDVKSVPLSPQAQRVLGVTAPELSPPQLISAILRAPVDLLWFGGIGTYIKASDEADADVGDHANDVLRVTSDQVRARVIAEGGNLAVTQRGRIRYSRRGGRINTDFIDNAAGVATSDREVNVKILLGMAIADGRIPAAGRDAELAAAEGFVAEEVLRQVDHSVSALNRAVPASARDLDAYEALLVELQAAGVLDAGVEDLPAGEEWVRRRRAGAGLIRPELAVVLAFAKSALFDAIEASALPDDPALVDVAAAYFPAAARERCADLVPHHRLYRQLVATIVAGDLVDDIGPVWAHETAAELDRRVAEVAAAYWAARQVLDAGEVLRQVELAGTSLSADADAALHGAVVDAVGRLARRYLATAAPDVSGLLDRDGPLARQLIGASVDGWDPDAPPAALGAIVADLHGAGAPTSLAVAVAARLAAVDVADAQVVAATVGMDPPDVLEGLAALDAGAGYGRLAGVLRRADVPGRWAAWQRRALLDDVAAWRASAVAGALGSGAPPAAAVAGWLAERRSGLDGLGQLLERLDSVERGDTGERRAVDTLALASMAVRRLPL
jgi:glutamate dehydrogenase